jgi:hypothetical protein
MDILSKLFGSTNKVKLMRLFLLNPEAAFATKEVAERSKMSTAAASRELKNLVSIDFIGRKIRGRTTMWQLNSGFPFINPLKLILKNNVLGRKKELVKEFNNCGRVIVLIVSGVFLESEDSRIDILVAGDNLRRKAIERLVKGLEAEIGKELVYVVMDTPDFIYRRDASDKFLRDVLDYPHEILVDKIGLVAPK